jgi:alkaline phosphatase D
MGCLQSYRLLVPIDRPGNPGRRKKEGVMLHAGRSLVVTIVLVLVAVPALANDFFPQSVASGDPTATSVVLWTRVVSDTEEEPKLLSLEMATDADFADIVVTREVSAWAVNDSVAKVKVGDLQPYTTYYYRFTYGGDQVSQTGRTKTAPTPDMDVPVRFAVVYCQDYIGRYYNAYYKMLLDHDEDIDFVVHLGDYIYETTGDPQFQDPDSERKIVFEDSEGAIQLGDDENPNYAAASLSNYRDIYRTYRDDPIFQQVHERWPMLVIWDDHEYSNDAWGATATYFNGRVNEFDTVRKQNSERAFFEWVPIDAGLDADGDLDIGSDDLWPNARIYRDLIYGANLHLVLTDLRTFRPDHLIAEDAFPGSIALDEATLAGLVGEGWPVLRESFDPYVDMRVLGAGLPIFRQTNNLIIANLLLTENPALDLFTAVRTAEEITNGNVSATFVNLAYQAAGLQAPFPPEVLTMLPRGLSYLLMGKQSAYSSGGSRTQVVKDTFDIYAAARYVETFGAAQEVYGTQQNAWLQGTLLASPATWKVLGHSFMMTPMVIDFTNETIAGLLPPEFPEVYRTKLVINAEDFNGLPQKRQEVLGLLDLVPNSVVISGDIHSTFVTDHKNGTYEITPPAISSSTNGEIVQRVIAADPVLGQIPGIEELLENYALLLQVSAFDPAVSSSDILYAETYTHGYGIFDVSADAMTITMQEISSDEIGTSYYDDPETLQQLFTPVQFTIRDGVIAPGP